MSQWVKGVGSTNFGNMGLRPDELEKVSFILVAGLAAVKPGESSRDSIHKIINFGRGAKVEYLIVGVGPMYTECGGELRSRATTCFKLKLENTDEEYVLKTTWRTGQTVSKE
ncbi:hypothetical protein FA13DRAFT_1799288 [Coprinellus micaceus]|uniref:Uncharacterized protein n=1 Tax=Coprinellus micaceus TaxID=71717 RepID=A0A4Y7SJW1_COPMI|nr:hypothetical protein FA13DRAFT_1799288 [Coprinellus micaceus]